MRQTTHLTRGGEGLRSPAGVQQSQWLLSLVINPNSQPGLHQACTHPSHSWATPKLCTMSHDSCANIFLLFFLTLTFTFLTPYPKQQNLRDQTFDGLHFIILFFKELNSRNNFKNALLQQGKSSCIANEETEPIATAHPMEGSCVV